MYWGIFAYYHAVICKNGQYSLNLRHFGQPSENAYALGPQLSVPKLMTFVTPET